MRGISKGGSGGVLVAAFPDAAASLRILHAASLPHDALDPPAPVSVIPFGRG
jgi:hypothetical protein